MASQQVRWKIAEVQRSIQALARDAESYEKEFQLASFDAEEVSRTISKLKTTTTTTSTDVVDDYPDSTTSSSFDVNSDTASVCSSETSADFDVVGYTKAKSSLYDVEEKTSTSAYSTSSVSSSRSKRGNERFRSRRRSQHEIKIA